MDKTCKDCSHLIGAGWNLHCTEHNSGYLSGLLLYNENTQSCEKYEQIIQINKEEFIKKYCHQCGTQRCEGPDTEWFDGCQMKKFLRTDN